MGVVKSGRGHSGPRALEMAKFCYQKHVLILFYCFEKI